MTQDASLIRDGDPAPFEIVNPDGATPLLLVADHASNAFPAHMDHLGLDQRVLDLHVAYDIGTRAITKRMAQRLDCPAVLAGYSRLLIDPNRQPGHPQSIPPLSDAIAIPGNQDLSEAAQTARVESFFTPYHHAITETLAHVWRHGPAPAFFSVHSFTPSIDGEDRIWDISVLWNRDPRIAVPLIDILRNHDHLTVGDNEPYSGKQLAYTLNRHGAAGGLANCAIEIRQDHCESEQQLDLWADMLSAALKEIMNDPEVHQVREY